MSATDPEHAGGAGDGGASVTWIGHATVLCQLAGRRLLVDPVVRSRVAHLRRYVAPVAPEHLAGVDAVLITHLHRDHLDLPSLRRLERAATLVVPRGARRLVAGLGFAAVVEVAPGDAVAIGAATVTATAAVHDGSRGPGGPRALTIGYVLGDGVRRVYHAGDTDIFPAMAAIGAPGIDLALLPVAGWGRTLGPGHLDPERAAAALALLRPRRVVPIHWGTLAPRRLGRGAPSWLGEPGPAFARAAARAAPDVEVVLLEPGGSFAIP